MPAKHSDIMATSRPNSGRGQSSSTPAAVPQRMPPASLSGDCFLIRPVGSRYLNFTPRIGLYPDYAVVVVVQFINGRTENLTDANRVHISLALAVPLRVATHLFTFYRGELRELYFGRTEVSLHVLECELVIFRVALPPLGQSHTVNVLSGIVREYQILVQILQKLCNLSLRSTQKYLGDLTHRAN